MFLCETQHGGLGIGHARGCRLLQGLGLQSYGSGLWLKRRRVASDSSSASIHSPLMRTRVASDSNSASNSNSSEHTLLVQRNVRDVGEEATQVQ